MRDLHLPTGMRIGAIYRDGEVLKPSRSPLKIQPRDRVVIFALADAVKQVEQLFRVSQFFDHRGTVAAGNRHQTINPPEGRHECLASPM